MNMEHYYLIQDNFCNYNGHLYLSRWDHNTPLQIEYCSQKYPTHADMNIYRVETRINQLEELSKGLNIKDYSWIIVDVNYEEWHHLQPKPNKQVHTLINFKIEKGKMVTVKKLVKDNYRKYDCIYRKLEKEWSIQNE